MQGGFLGLQKRLKPFESVLVLEDGVSRADDTQHLAICRAANGSVSDLMPRVGSCQGTSSASNSSPP